MKRILKWVLAIAVLALTAFFALAPAMIEKANNKVAPSAAAITSRALALHKTLTIADLHSDTLLWKRDPLERADRAHVDLPRLVDGNVALQIFASTTKSPKGQNYDSNTGETDNITLLAFAQLQPLRTWTSLLERSLWHAIKLGMAEDASKGSLRIIRTQADLASLLADRAAGKQVTGGMLSIEGLHNLEGKRANLDTLYKAGFRMAGFAHFFDSEVAGSMHGVKKGGLTPLGRQVFADMEAKGMIIDIAHSSHAAVAEMLALATRPVVSSHGGVQATCKVNRNLTDDEIKGVAKTGGVIGIGYWDAAICSSDPRAIAKAVKHVRDLVGIDFVGLGSDFDGSTTTPFDTAGLAHVTQTLIDAGFTDADIGKVMGGNVMRVLAQTLPTR